MQKWNIFRQLRRLYYWVLHWADHPQNVKALCGLAFIESSFFPIPPDILLIAMGASKPKKSFLFAFYCTLFSVLGGLLGYYIGSELWSYIKDFFIGGVIKAEHFDLVQQKFSENAFLAIFIAGFTPVPYKVFTLTAGVVGLPMLPFLFGSILGRGGRFFIIGALLFFFGEKIKDNLENNFEKWSLLLGAILVLIVYLLKVR